MRIDKFASRVDLIGVLAFLYVIVYSIIALVKEVNFLNLILLIIGIGGFALDFFISIKTRLKLDKKLK